MGVVKLSAGNCIVFNTGSSETIRGAPFSGTIRKGMKR